MRYVHWALFKCDHSHGKHEDDTHIVKSIEWKKFLFFAEIQSLFIEREKKMYSAHFGPNIWFHIDTHF